MIMWDGLAAMFRNRLFQVIGVCSALIAAPAFAEVELGFYTGIQEAPHSRVEGTDPGGVGPFSFLATWEGRSFEAPPYVGVRATYWTDRNPRLGYGIDYSHAKVTADLATRTASGFTQLEFTDGLNTLTANLWYRWPKDDRKWLPYVGAGAGIAFPGVDVGSVGGRTFEYQVTGPAVQVVAGIKYNFNDRWGVFGEYKGTYTMNEVDLDNGGTLSTDIMTNALNIGVSFSF